MARQKIHNLDDIKQLGTICGIWAHPDDESFTCAGLMAAAIENGQQVICITATKGEVGVQDPERWPPHRLGDIRTHEMVDALEVIGVERYHWLGYSDGGCKKANQHEAVQRIEELLNAYRPDTLLTFGPDGFTGHADHQSVSQWAQLANKELPGERAMYHVVQSRDSYDNCVKAIDERFDIFFNIDEPPLRDEDQCDICFKLPDKFYRQKLQALSLMPSQYEAMLNSLTPEELRMAFSTECFEIA